jgi:hypothetical protein
MKAIGLTYVSNKLQHYHHENKTWVRSLDFFKQENSHLKNRLSEVVDMTMDKTVLAQAEHFQNLFIIKDEFLDQLRHDVNEQERILTDRYIRTGNGVDEYVTNRQKQLREQMDYLEKDFAAMRNEFNRYLVATL